jgi:hypothetical protein
MRHVIFFSLLMLGILIGVGSPELTGQVLKTDKKETKVDPKVDLKNEKAKEIEWPKKILNKTLDQWVRDMVIANQKDASMRDQAIKTVPLFGPDARKAASKNMIEVLRNDPDINVKLTAISTVPLLGFDDRDLDDGLAALMAFVNKNLSKASNHTRYEVTMALGSCGPIAKKAIPLLAEWTLTDFTSWQNRKAACFALGRLGMPTPLPPGPMAKPGDPPKMSDPDVAAVHALSSRLTSDTSYQVRREAVQSLLLLGPPGNPAAWGELRKALTTAFKDSDISTRIWAHVTFIRTELNLIKPNDPNLKAVIGYCDHEEPAFRLEAVQALGTIGNEASSALSLLQRLAMDPKLATINVKEMTVAERDMLTIAATAIWSLGQMTSEQNKLVPVLTELQQHKNEFIKAAAKDAYTNLVRAGDPKFEPPPKKDIKKP